MSLLCKSISWPIYFLITINKFNISKIVYKMSCLLLSFLSVSEPDYVKKGVDSDLQVAFYNELGHPQFNSNHNSFLNRQLLNH